jgi:hypothetical protein
MSGRTLRRLPVLAHARYVGQACADPIDYDDESEDGDGHGTAVEVWIEAMERVVKDEGLQMEKLEKAVDDGAV